MTTYVIDASLSPAVAGVAAAITAQTAALVVQNELLRNAIAGLVLAVSELKDSSSGVSKSLSDINSAVGSLSVVVTQAATVAEASAASQIEINNFNKAVTIDGYQRLDMPLPKMPTLLEQIKTAVENSSVLSTQIRVQNLISDKIKATVTDIQSWITSSVIYQSTTAWITKQKDIIIAAILPSSAKAKAAALAAASGVPPVVY